MARDELEGRLEQLVKEREILRGMRGRFASIQEKADICFAMNALEQADVKEKLGIPAPADRSRTRDVVADLLHHAPCFVQQTYSTFLKEKSLEPSVHPGNRTVHRTELGDALSLREYVRRLLRDRHAENQRVIACDVTAWLFDGGWIDVDMDNKADVLRACRLVNRWLTRCGFERGKRRGKWKWDDTLELKRKRAAFLELMNQIESAKDGESFRFVYLDESYIHKHYHDLHRNSMFDPTDDNDCTSRWCYKGSRFCFAAMIIDADKAVRPSAAKRDADGFARSAAHLIPESFVIFENGAKDKSGDYHKNFSFAGKKDSFAWGSWFRDMMVACKGKYGRCCFVLDGASYHTTKQDRYKKSPAYMNLATLRECFADFGLAWPARMNRDQRAALLQAEMDKHEALGTTPLAAQPLISQWANQLGHKVVFTPPYHSDVQPIEKIWSIGKRRACSTYKKGRTMAELEEAVRREFLVNLTSETVQACISHADRVRKELGELDSDDVGASGTGVGGPTRRATHADRCRQFVEEEGDDFDIEYVPRAEDDGASVDSCEESGSDD